MFEKRVRSICDLLNRSLLLCGAITTGIAGSWDSSFETSYQNNVLLGIGEGARAVTVIGGEVYVGTFSSSYSGGSGHLFRYTESTGVWEELATFEGSIDGGYETGVLDLSAGTEPNGAKSLFVGGNFTMVTYGTNISQARCIVNLDISSPTSRNINKMGTSTVYGTDGPVYALKAQPWYDYSGGSLHSGIRCVVGGIFTNAGSVTSKSIALWQQGTAVFSGWSGLSGGLVNDGVSGPPKVYGVEASTFNGYYGETLWADIWLTGAFTKNVGTNTAVHAARLVGSYGAQTWNYLGQIFQRTNYSGGVEVYPSFFGQSIGRVGNTVYYGGYGSAHLTSGNTIISCGTHGLVSSLGNNISAHCNIIYVVAMAAKGSDLYAAGTLWYDNFGNAVRYGRLSAGVWTALSGAPASFATDAAASSTKVYFVTPVSGHRYTP